ncbi:PQQ-binding-like beta-propeller repeat protein [Actinomadura nitritigenes]|uniref:outer membrane protein assembly factor BamB family protein n=1 Tax=Actinomadura nitritigenes TaxID=134602 RepID=UPI003D8FFF12
MTASPQAVEAFDARTGAPVWRSASFDHSEVTAFALSGQQVVIVTRAGRWFGVDAPTGRMSWRSRSPSGTLIHYSDKLQVLATSTTVPVVSLGTRTIRGIDGRTGRTKWNIGRQQLYGCTLDTSQIAQTSSVETKRYVSDNWLAVPVVCGSRNAVVAVDAASGRATWRHGTMTPGDTPQSSANDRFVGINDNGYGVFEQGTGKDSHKLAVQDPSGRVQVVLNKAQSYDIWGPLSPLATVGSHMIIPFLRNGKHYFATMAVSGSRPSITHLSEDVLTATFDDSWAYGIRQDGSVEVAAVGQAAPVRMGPAPKGKVFWIATGNASLFIATSSATPEENQVTITSIGN